MAEKGDRKRQMNLRSPEQDDTPKNESVIVKKKPVLLQADI